MIIDQSLNYSPAAFDLEIAPYLFVSLTQFASMFVSLTLLPSRLAAPPYSLSPTLIGVCYLPSGIGMMLGSVLGGKASDRSADEAYASRRLVPALVGSLLLPVGCFGYGFFFEHGVHIAAPLVRPWYCRELVALQAGARTPLDSPRL